MASDNSWFIGLMTGLSQAMGQSLILQKERELQEQDRQMQVAGNLLRSGDYETLKYLDPKVKKSMGFTPELEQHFDQMILLQQKARQQQSEMQQEQVATSRLQRQAGELKLGEAQRRSDILSQMPLEEQKTALIPGLDAPELAQQKLELQKQQIQLMHEDRVAGIEARKLQVQAILDERAGRAQTKAEAQETKKLQNADINYRRAVDALNKIEAMRPRDKDKNNEVVPFSDQVTAKAFADKLNRAEKEVQRHGNTIAGLTDGSPEEPTNWIVQPDHRWGPLGGRDRFYVVPEMKTQDTQPTTAPRAEKPKHAFEGLLKPENKPVQFTAKTPQEASRVLKVFGEIAQGPKDERGKLAGIEKLVNAGVDRETATRIINDPAAMQETINVLTESAAPVEVGRKRAR